MSRSRGKRIEPISWQRLAVVLESFGFQDMAYKRPEWDHLVMRKGNTMLPPIPKEPKRLRVGIIQRTLIKAGISKEQYFASIDRHK